jgi:hypothetical protein
MEGKLEAQQTRQEQEHNNRMETVIRLLLLTADQTILLAIKEAFVGLPYDAIQKEKRVDGMELIGNGRKALLFRHCDDPVTILLIYGTHDGKMLFFGLLEPIKGIKDAHQAVACSVHLVDERQLLLRIGKQTIFGHRVFHSPLLLYHGHLTVFVLIIAQETPFVKQKYPPERNREDIQV